MRSKTRYHGRHSLAAEVAEFFRFRQPTVNPLSARNRKGFWLRLSMTVNSAGSPGEK